MNLISFLRDRFSKNPNLAHQIRVINGSALSPEDKTKAINGLKREADIRGLLFWNNAYSRTIDGLFGWEGTPEGWEFWNRIRSLGV